MEQNEKLREYLKALRLHWLRDNYKSEIENAVRVKLSYEDFLSRLAEGEVLSKKDRSINCGLQRSGFPQIKRLEEFDFSFQPKLDEKLIRELAGLSFMYEAKNILFLGPPGVGKTHLAIAMGIKACEGGKKVGFYTTEALMNRLAEAEVTGQLKKVLNTIAKIDLLIIDELGYLELTKKTANLFFQIISARYENKSTIVTTNKSFDGWGGIFQDDIVASAILDRLLHHSHTFFILGKSFRMKNILKN
jgi:DNA replication protein DnaC